ncbi:GlsB/YeaQ/YmgE family stress response membrane protein [Lacticaseibacillus sharpeae]|nr:GlsB/YeaQ/YmgE family stress response membrane protein [Lacticaseibacillus sharpeae]
MTHFIAIIIVGAIIGSIGAGFTHRDLRAGCGGNIVAGLIGSWIGTRFLGDWGWHVAGIAIFPSIIGAMVFVLLASLFIGSERRH